MKQRTISFILALAMLIGLLPAVAIPKAEAAPSASTSTVTSLFKARSEGLHPRIFANEEDFARVRKLVQTDSYMKIWYAHMYNYCEEQLLEPLCAYELADGKKLLSVCKLATNRIVWMSFLYQVSGEQRFAERAVAEMINVCGFKDWNPSHYLDVAQMCYAVGLGYDWLYHYMTDSQRKTVMNGLYKNGISTTKSPKLSESNNWNAWCNGGLSIGAAAIFEDHPTECAQILSDAVSNIQIVMAMFEPAGAYPEGPGYYKVTVEFTVMLINTLESVLGTDFGLSEVDGFRDSGRYPLAVNGYSNCFNFGDGNERFMEVAALFWYADRYHMPELALFQRENQTVNDLMDQHLAMLWYNPELLEGVDENEQQLDYFLMNDDYESIASFRSFPGDEAQIYAAIKSGNNQSPHTDMDVGTFVLEAMGERWFTELGKDNYSLTGYMSRGENGQRWTYYRKRAEGQNTLVINPDSTGGQAFDAKCQIIDYQSGYDGGYATVKMLDAYDLYGAKNMKRALALFDNRSRVLLRDEINLNTASTIYWFAHTKANISISADGKTAELTMNGKTLLAQISTPAEAKFTKMSAKPLSSSPNPSGQDANAGYNKLVIKLTKTQAVSITVVFTPLLSESDRNKSLPAYGITNTGKLLKKYNPTATLTPNGEGVYEIYDAEQLMLLSQMVSEGTNFSGKTVKLMNDIDLKGRSFIPIGSNDTGAVFKGTFDGCGHVVNNLFVYAPEGSGVGFFGKVNGATIQNFGIESGAVYGGAASGGLVGVGISFTVNNCFNRANVTSSAGNSGGLIGQVGGTSTIKNSYNHSFVKCSSNGAGGIVGYASSSSNTTVENCYHVGNLSDSGGKTGLIGYYGTTNATPIAKMTVKNCRATTALKGSTVADNSALESYSGSSKITAAQMVSAAVPLGSSFIYDCEWENGGYPVLSWQCDTTLPEDLILSTPAELRLLAYKVNSGETQFKGQTVRLAKDIDLKSREWTPIGGNNSTDAAAKRFEGTFDGQGYSISNLNVSSKYHYVGFFGTSSGKIMNLGIDSGRVVGGNKSAGLAGYASGTISNCYSRATVTGTSVAGGLVGFSAKTAISNCYANAAVTATTSAGGLVGYYASSGNGSSITNCYATGTLSGKQMGALVSTINAAVTDLAIKNSYALSGNPLIYSTTGYTLSGSSSQSAANLKAKVSALGAAFRKDDYVAKNDGYPVLTVSLYKSAVMEPLQPASDGEYDIYTARELRSLAYMVNELGETFAGKTVHLCEDIDLENEEWIPIGGNAPEDGGSSSKFAGIFDGGGHCISNLSITGGNHYVGFFGDVNGATIRNFGIRSGMVKGSRKVGAIAGTARGNVLISGCYNRANVSGLASVGGIVGMNGGSDITIENCYNVGTVGNSGSSGGIVGYLSGSATNNVLRNCYNLGKDCSGIVGNVNATATGTVINCYTIDSVSPVGTANALVLTDSGKLSAADLRNAAERLGSAFAEDYFTNNRCYPVLAWENGETTTSFRESNGVYEIGSPEELHLLSYYVRKGNTFDGKKFVLTADLDLGGRLWLPIGGKDETGTYAFRADFDGRGHVIRNLDVKELEGDYGALFGIVGNARIENMGIENSTILSNTRSSALVATAQGGTVISNCYSRAMVYGRSQAGGLLAYASGANIVLENCYNTGGVFGRMRSANLGGLVGYMASTATNFQMRNSYSVDCVYGILGSANASTTGSAVNCYSVPGVKLICTPNSFDASASAQVSAETLRGYASVLGEAFESDSRNINQGYPVLTWENETAPIIDETLKISHTLNLAGDISVTFAVPVTALAAYDSYYLECVLPEYEGNELTGTSTVRIEPVVNGKYYYFTLTGITAVRMGDMVEAVLHMTKGDQEYLSKTDSYSVATYAYAMLNSTTDSKMLTLCADLLRYGAEAQSFKGYRTDALVDAAMTEEQRAYLSDMDSLTFSATDSYLGDLASPEISWVGKTLDLGAKVGIKFVFNAANYSGDIANLSMKVSYQGSTGETKTVTLTDAEVYSANNGYYSFTFYGLLASELRTIVDVAIYEGETQLSESLRYSAESYASRNPTGELAPLCKALFAYSDSAKAFFAK